MSVGFLVTSPYQVHHYRAIARHLPGAEVVIEVREQEYGLSEEFIAQHLPDLTVHWVSRERLARLDGHFRAIVCQTPVLPLEFPTSSLVVAQQYSLAKERYQYGLWRAHAHLNLMYGAYSQAKVAGFCHAVAVGNPLLDGYFQDPPQRAPLAGRRPRLLYLPTYGELSSLPAVLPRLSDLPIDITVKPHHAEDPAVVTGGPATVRIVGPETDPAELLRTHDWVLSDFSGSAFDALYVGLPVVIATTGHGPGPDHERLSEAERDRSLLGDLVAFWPGTGDLLAAFERAAQRLDSAAYREFVAGTFVNPGTAGEACAAQIQRLLEEGEPEHFGTRQVRETTRRYIVRNRELRAQVGHRSPNGAVVTGRSWLDPWLFYRRTRRFLARSHRLRRVVRGVRRRVRAHPARLPLRPGPPPAAPPAQRREEVFAALAPHLAAERVTVVRDHDAPGAEVAVLTTGKRALHRALRRLGEERADLLVRVGTEVRAAETLPLARLSFHDLFGAHWLEIGTPRERGTYRIGVGGYLSVLFVEHDPVKNRYLALKKRAERTDWTPLFRPAAPAAPATPATPAVPAAPATPAGSGAVAAAGERRSHLAEPVDVVYTWVDSGDPAWREVHQRYSQDHAVHNLSADNAERYIDREELRYSLRALWLFAPFVRHIYLVTADQRPTWLADHPQLTVVPHREIFPDPSVLPTFNSHAIEACLHRIPGLSEHFLYLNDDVFLGREANEGDFFTMAGLAKVRLSPSQYIYQGRPEPDAIPTDWAAYHAVSLLRRDFGLSFDRRVQHVPLSQRRSVLAEVEQRYPDEVARTRRARFREPTDVALPSMFGQFYGIATGRAVEWPTNRNEYQYLDTGRRNALERFDQILAVRPKFFCLNATRYAEIPLVDQARHLHDFLAPAFPTPAPWEAEGAPDLGTGAPAATVAA